MVTAYFLDTSALLKRYVSEKGTAWIQSLTAQSTIICKTSSFFPLCSLRLCGSFKKVIFTISLRLLLVCKT